MKSETEIAEYFIKNIRKYGFRQSAEQHNEDCQRWLEFLDIIYITKGCDTCKMNKKRHKEKITDLKSAIKLYDDAGV